MVWENTLPIMCAENHFLAIINKKISFLLKATILKITNYASRKTMTLTNWPYNDSPNYFQSAKKCSSPTMQQHSTK